MTDMIDDRRLLQAQISHLRRALAVKDQEAQRLRAELRRLQSPVAQVGPKHRQLFHNDGVER
jgi:uncharacterized protein (DUF3084 family)